jgi:hypothetical protein
MRPRGTYLSQINAPFLFAGRRSSFACLCAVLLASTLAGCGSHRRASTAQLLTVQAVRAAFVAHGLSVGRDDTAPGVRRALRHSHVTASMLVTARNGAASVAEVRIFDSAARARSAVRRTRQKTACLGSCDQSETFSAVRIRNVVVAAQPLYAATPADTADLQRLLAAIHALRTR